MQALLRRLRSDVDSERAIADARPEHAGEDAVQVMTIHGAKGLEFRHCYLVQLHKGPGGNRGRRAEAGGEGAGRPLGVSGLRRADPRLRRGRRRAKSGSRRPNACAPSTSR